MSLGSADHSADQGDAASSSAFPVGPVAIPLVLPVRSNFDPEESIYHVACDLCGEWREVSKGTHDTFADKHFECVFDSYRCTRRRRAKAKAK